MGRPSSREAIAALASLVDDKGDASARETLTAYLDDGAGDDAGDQVDEVDETPKPSAPRSGRR